MDDSTDRPDEAHVRPQGVDDATVEATGKLSEALEAVEDARGHLYAFHRLCGRGDLLVGEAVDLLRAADHDSLATLVAREVQGRNVLEGRWSFQIVEEYDDGYYRTFRAVEKEVRDQLVGGRRHLYEAEMKERLRTHGHPDHTAQPSE